MSSKLFRMLGVVALLVGLGCKKDEPESAADESESATSDKKNSPQKVADGDKGTKKGALKTGEDEEKAGEGDDEEPPPTRSLRKARHQKPGTAKDPDARKATPRKVGEPSARLGLRKPRTGRPGFGPPGPGPKGEKERPRVRPGTPATGPRRLRPATGADGDAEDDDEDEAPLTPRERARRARKDRRERGASGPRHRTGGPMGGPPDAGPASARDRANPRARDRGPASRHRVKTPTTQPRPNAERLLLKEELTKVLGLKFTVDVHALSGIASDHGYDGVYWGNADGSKYVAGVQMWALTTSLDGTRRFAQMSRSYPNAKETPALGAKTKALLAYWNDFIYLAFYDSAKQTVVSLTCHRKMCDSPQKLVELAKLVKGRL